MLIVNFFFIFIAALYERCDSDSDCLEGGECRKNGNATTAVGKNVMICLCEPGRVEDKGYCSGKYYELISWDFFF